MPLTQGQDLTGKWAGCTLDRISGGNAWVRAPVGLFNVPLETLIREMEEPP